MNVVCFGAGMCAFFLAAQAFAQVPVPPAGRIPFSDTDTLADIRAKIELNGYQFKVATNRIFNLTPGQKKQFFSRHASGLAAARRYSPGIGPLADQLGKTALPGAFCWTNVSGHSYIGPVRDQGGCGSCYSFGACAAAEGAYNARMGRYDGQCMNFSESFVAWCLGRVAPYSDHFFGCDGADYSYYELEALVQVGVTPEAFFPYTETDPGACTRTADPRVKFASWHRVPCGDIAAIKTAILTYGVVDAAVQTTPAFDSYASGIYSDTSTSCPGAPCEDTTTDHAIALVGWDDANGGSWILRNSWGSIWGESGYMRISYQAARAACSVAYFVYEPQVLPPRPQPASAVAASRFTANWLAASNALAYRLDVASNSAFRAADFVPAYSNRDAGAALGCVVTGLAANTTYYYCLRAMGSIDTSWNSATGAVTTARAPAAATNITIMAANISSGNYQAYEDPGVRIFQGLKPDVVAIQEFNVQSGAIADFVARAFGAGYQYYRGAGDIPNGIVSRWPIRAAGEWTDAAVGNRTFAWATLDIPGPVDLHVVSVHLLTTGSAERSAEAAALKTNILARFPAQDFVVVAGDFNVNSRTETAMGTFKTFLSDDHQPADQNGNKNTNAGRNNPYDYVLPNFALDAGNTNTVVLGYSFSDGLVYDSRVSSPYALLPAPIQAGDSGVSGMQHMGVLKTFYIPAAGGDEPQVAVFAPPASVPYETTALALSGTASRAAGQMAWTNSLGGGGLFAAATNWSCTVALQVGGNTVTVTATNFYGAAAQAVTLLRLGPAAPPAPALRTVTGIGSNRFDAVWEAAARADAYWLDAATNAAFRLGLGGWVTNAEHGGTLGAGTGGVWTEQSLAQGTNSGKGYLRMTDPASLLASPAVSLAAATGAKLSFRARTYGGVSGSSAEIAIAVSTNGGASWTAAAVRAPTNSTLQAMADVDLGAWAGQAIRARLQTLSATGGRGVGVDNVVLASQGAAGNDFVPGYVNRAVGMATSAPVTGLLSRTMYYYRVRAGNSGGLSPDSAAGTVLTLAPEEDLRITWIQLDPARSNIMLGWTGGTGLCRVLAATNLLTGGFDFLGAADRGSFTSPVPPGAVRFFKIGQ